MAMPMMLPTPRPMAPGQRGHVAVVGNHNGNVADLLGGAVVDGLDLVPLGAGNLAGTGTATMGALPMKMPAEDTPMASTRGILEAARLERGYDAVIMVLGVCLELGEPDDFLGIDALAVNHGGDLPVGAAGVEADAAAVQIAADGFGDLVGSGAIFQRQVNDLQIHAHRAG